MKLSIIIVSWNVVDKLRVNLNNLFLSETQYDYEVIVVDNNSSDDTCEMIKSEFPQVKLIENNDNLGFARANNIAIKKVKSGYVLLLNPDMQVRPDTIENMINWFITNDNVWLASCHLVDQNDQTITNVRKFPTLFDQLMIVLKVPHIFPGVLSGYLRKDFDYSQDSKVDSVRGGFFMLNLKNFRDMPLLDERYFLWFEEVDFCRQVKASGGDVYYSNAAKCTDLVGQSFKQVKRFTTQKYFRDSMLKYFYKWQGAFPFVVLYIAWIPMIILAYFIDLLHIKGRAKT